MANPTVSSVHVDRPLTNISVAYQQDTNDYIAAQVFPRVPVQKQSDQYFTYGKGDWFRSEAAVRPPSTETPGTGYRISTDTYYAYVYGVHRDIDDQLRANADAPINVDREATLLVTNQMLLKRDKDWAATYFTTGLWTGTDTGADQTGVAAAPAANQFLQWDQAGSDPIDDIAKQQVAMKEKTGRTPNTLVLGPYVYSSLRQNDSIIERIKYTQRGVLTRELLAQMFDVDRVLIAGATENTALEGAAATMSYVFGKAALLCYSAPNPGLMTPSAGYIFTWDGLLPGGSFGTAISRFRLDHLKSTRIEGEMSYDMKVVANDLGAFFTAAVA